MNKKITQATKEEIAISMKNNAISTITKKRRANKVVNYYEEDGEIEFYNKYQIEEAEKDNLGLEFRLYMANNKRKERIKARITKMVETNKALFLTLTFSDKMFNRKTTSETRRRYIARFLKEQCSEYLANIDFGSTNGREHYHAVVVPKGLIDFNRYRDLFDSNINSKKIRVNEDSIKNVGVYINKLTNHALKENGEYKRLIYSRQVGHILSWYICTTN